MCGIAGLYSPRRFLRGEPMGDVIGRMVESLRHRGPDDQGTWIDPDADVALGHRRLSIIDLSELGHQPMVSSDGRHVMVFNGEIYNFADLRRQLEAKGEQFRGGSDTEVLLSLVACRGFETALEQAVGMFSIAVWDRGERSFYLARDRLGQKPLYYGHVGRSFVFASELKAFATLPGMPLDIDHNALAAFLRRQYIPAPATIWQGIRKLPAGTWLKVRLSGGLPGLDELEAAIHPYWSARDAAEAGAASALSDEVECIEALDAQLAAAVRDRMIADVPLGAFLSGGIDSSLIVSLMQAQSSRPVRTYTVSFGEEGYNEAVAARGIVEKLGTDHTEIHVSSAEAREIIPDLPNIYDEPFADVSQIPTWHVSRVAAESVTVALSGDGGDELFGGYGRYQVAASIRERLRRIPLAMRQALAAAARTVPVGSWDAVLRLAGTTLPHGYRGNISGDRVHKLASLLAAEDRAALYRALLEIGTVDVLTSEVRENTQEIFEADFEVDLDEFIHQMMYYDIVTYLPEDIMTKVDRASMSVGLEVRSPLLDHRVVELAWCMPLSVKVQSGEGKRPLRKLLERHLPEQSTNNVKRGFSVPISEWLRGPLREWSEELLCQQRLTCEGLLDANLVQQLWNEHKSGHRNWAHSIWNILMFQAWRDNWCDPSLAHTAHADHAA